MKAIRSVGIGVAAFALGLAGTAGATAQAQSPASASVAGERFHSEHPDLFGCQVVGLRGEAAGAWDDYRCVFAYITQTYWLYVTE